MRIKRVKLMSHLSQYKVFSQDIEVPYNSLFTRLRSFFLIKEFQKRMSIKARTKCDNNYFAQF